jgi:bromodomain-containing protein 9
LRYLDDDLDFLSRKDQDKRSNSNNVNDDMSFNGHVKKTLSKNAPDQSCLLQKERINKPISRNSEDNLSSSFHKKQRKKLISRHSEDDLNCPSGRDRARKVISKNSENDENSPFHKHQVKKSAPQRSIDGLSFQEKHIKKPIDGNGEDPGFSSCKRRIEDPFCTNVEDASFSSTKRLSEKPMSEKPISINKEEDLDHCHQESSKKPSCRVEQDDHGYSCDEEAVKKPGCMDSHDAQGSDISAATIASVGDGSNGLSMPQPNNSEPTGCTVANGVIDKDISSPLDEIRSEKTDDILGTIFFLFSGHLP